MAPLSLAGGPLGSDPSFFFLFGVVFRQTRRYLACRADNKGRVYRLLDYASTGVLAVVPSSSCSPVRQRLFFFFLGGDSDVFRPCA